MFQGAQAVTDLAFIASQSLHEFIMAQDGPALGASRVRHQALEDLALQPGQASGRHNESFCKGAKGGSPSLLSVGRTADGLQRWLPSE